MNAENLKPLTDIDFVLMTLILEAIASQHSGLAVVSIALNTDQGTIEYAKQLAEFVGKRIEAEENLKDSDCVVLPVSAISKLLAAKLKAMKPRKEKTYEESTSSRYSAGCLVGNSASMRDHEKFMKLLNEISLGRDQSQT
jgi:hypothetical protein